LEKVAENTQKRNFYSQKKTGRLGKEEWNVTFDHYLNEQLKDPEFNSIWEETEPEYQLTCQIIEARKRNHISQKELAEKTGIHAADICKLEKGNANPSLKTLKRVAEGLGMRLKIEFIPK
jgi:ribosome-binding protein aMBF1 (putative translation factor)